MAVACSPARPGGTRYAHRLVPDVADVDLPGRLVEKPALGPLPDDLSRGVPQGHIEHLRGRETEADRRRESKIDPQRHSQRIVGFCGGIHRNGEPPAIPRLDDLRADSRVHQIEGSRTGNCRHHPAQHPDVFRELFRQDARVGASPRTLVADLERAIPSSARPVVLHALFLRLAFLFDENTLEQSMS